MRAASVLWTFETEVYGPQRNVSTVNRESKSAGYAVANLGAEWGISEDLTLTLGVENLFDKKYSPHLGGYNRALNPDIGVMERLPAQGTNVFIRGTYKM
jgi:iron complex outermembrane receptor protein